MEITFDKWDRKSKGIQSNPAFKETIESLYKQLMFVWHLSDLIWSNGNVNFLITAIDVSWREPN